MPVKALYPYPDSPKDTVDRYHGMQMVFINWEEHLMFCPGTLLLDPNLSFNDFLNETLAGVYSVHPDFSKIDWAATEWLKNGEPFTPDLSKSLIENGIGHKASLRFTTPGLHGISGS